MAIIEIDASVSSSTTVFDIHLAEKVDFVITPKDIDSFDGVLSFWGGSETLIEVFSINVKHMKTSVFSVMSPYENGRIDWVHGGNTTGMIEVDAQMFIPEGNI